MKTIERIDAERAVECLERLLIDIGSVSDDELHHELTLRLADIKRYMESVK